MHCTHTCNPCTDNICSSQGDICKNVQLTRMDKIAIRVHLNIYSFSPQMEPNLLCPY